MFKSAKKVLDKYEEMLLKKPFVVSVAVENNKLIVLTEKHNKVNLMTHEQIPKTLDKIPVEVRVIS
jgi:hypothetical protein